jgi:hypothetical protein
VSKIARVEDLHTNGALNRFVEIVLLTGASTMWPEASIESNKQYDNSGCWGVPTGRVEAAEGLMALVTTQRCESQPVFRALARLMHDPYVFIRRVNAEIEENEIAL